MKLLTHVSIAVLICLPALCSAQVSITEAGDWAYMQDEHIKVGLLKTHGGAVAYLSKTGGDENLLDHYDKGRLVQQSYYGDPDDSKWVEKAWCYNPVQGGDYRGTAAVVREFRVQPDLIYVRTTPRHWASGELLTECDMEQTVQLNSGVVRIHYAFAYNGKITHRVTHQETPAVFLNPKYRNFVVRPISGDADGKMVSTVPKFPNQYTSMDEGWAAYVDDQQEGVGIFVPTAKKATYYRYEAGGESDCSYVAPLQEFALKPGLKFSYEAFLCVGTADEILDKVTAIRNDDILFSEITSQLNQ